MKVAFYKFHGTGNDFILIDLTKISLSFTKKDISDLCDRHFGIGADGLILLRSTAMCDFHMQYFNSDGKEGTMCGNGGRCTVAFAQLMGVIDQSARFIAIDGVHTGEVISMHSNIYNIRLQLNNTEMPEIINDGYLINTGSPHFVKFVENNQEVDVVEEGRKIRNRRDLWPDGVNVNFVSVSDGGINVRTYERGVENETLSCGTGVTASAICASLHNKIFSRQVNVFTKGGLLKVGFMKVERRFTDIQLEGPATLVFHGEVNVE